jgi:uncharacterized membrane protein
MRVTLYSKQDCPLCDQARADLEALQSVVPHRLVEIDVASDPILNARHGAFVPVIEVGPYTMRPPFTRIDLRVTLLSAQQGRRTRQPLSGRARQRAVALNRGLAGLARRWLLLLNTLVFVYVGLPFLAPVLMKAGSETPARWIYAAYGPVCHQLAFRSWFLFGEQAAYPRSLAGLDGISYGAATGLAEDDLLSARAFLGNEALGYKVALCERDVAIYGGIFVAGLVFGLVRRRVRPLPLWAWVAFGILPMAIDGGSQLLSGLPLLPVSWGMRESTPFLRTATGLLFGVLNVWLAYPHLEETMAETRTAISVKLAGEPPA